MKKEGEVLPRTNLFDLLASHFDIATELGRIERLAESEDVIRTSPRDSYTLYEYVEKFCFEKWKNRGRCLDLDDFVEVVDYAALWKSAPYDFKDLLLLIEIVYNFWYMVHVDGVVYQPYQGNLSYTNTFCLLKQVMDDVLAHYNYKGEYFPDEEQLIVTENCAAATAVAEITDAEIGRVVLKYNHFVLKGDLAAKKNILVSLGGDLEPKRVTLEAIDKQLTSDIFFMLNNMNLRHNNCVPGTPKYKVTVDALDDKAMEEWYDELYQMILLAYLKLDHEQRKPKISHLKDCVSGGILL